MARVHDRARRATAFCGGLLLAALAVPAAAQPSGPPSTIDASVGGSLWLEEGSAVGISASLAFYPLPFLGIVGDLGHYGLKGDSKMGGLRLRRPHREVTPFVQLLIGEAPLDTIAFQPGMGLEWRLAPHVALRLAADLKLAGDGGATYTGVRLSAGVAFGNR